MELLPPVEVMDASDPYARTTQTFPTLSADQVERARAHGEVHTFAEGAAVFSRGDRSVDFFIVLRGALEIFDVVENGAERVLALHGPGQFTGELDLFNDRHTLVNARAREESVVLRIDRSHLRRLLSSEPDIGELVMRALILRRVGLIQHVLGGVVLVGPQRSADVLRVQRFLMRNGYPMRTVDTDSDDGAHICVHSMGAADGDFPLLIHPDGTVLRNPTNEQVAESLGLAEDLGTSVHDVIVVGAGPAGLAAAVYAASEGLDTLVLEADSPGGQAGTSSKIENYLGFPTGISGQALAGRAQVQAQKFGAKLGIARNVKRLHCEECPYAVELEGGTRVLGRSIVVATGARYQGLDVPGYKLFEGQGIHYAATPMEGALCKDDEAIVVGGGNSAGQAAVFLSRIAKHVHMLVRADGLAATMSDYLVQRITGSSRITLHTATEIADLAGDKRLQRVTWRNRKTGASETRDIGNVFVMIGASPNTAWLDGCLPLDAKGFVLTGADVKQRTASSPYETAIAGVFAVGDVRAGSVKRVASAVGEGSVVVHAIHRHLATLAERH